MGARRQWLRQAPDGDFNDRAIVADFGDAFTPTDLGAIEHPPAGEVVFASGQDILTRRWTWRQAAGTQTLARTRDAFFNVDGLPPCSRADVGAAMADVQRLVSLHTGAEVQAALLDIANLVVAFD